MIAPALLAGFFLMCFVQRGVLFLPGELRGIFPVSDVQAETAEMNGTETAETSGTDIQANRWRIRAAEGQSFPYIERLAFGLQLDMQTVKGAPKLVVTAECLQADGTTQAVRLTDINPLYVGTEVLRLQLSDVYAIEIETEDGEPFSISDVRIDNHFRFNGYVFIFGFAAALSLLLLMTTGGDRPARAFLCVILPLGTAMVLSLPASKVGADEEAHLQAVMDIAALPHNAVNVSDELLHQLLVTVYNDPDALPGGLEESEELNTFLAEHADYKTGNNAAEFVTLANRVPAYAAMALAVKAGKLFSLSWPALLLLARFTNLLVYAALMYFAIRIAPFAKQLLFVTALFPQSVFLAGTVSYDPFINGCLALGMACLLRAFTDDGHKLRAFLCGEFFLFLGCLPKAVYAPLLLTGCAVLLPDAARSLRFGRRKAVFYFLPVLLFVLLMASFILPTVISPAETGDLRGGATSEVSQVGYILSQPLAYAWLLLRQMIAWIPKCFFWADCTVFMGHLVNGTTAFGGFPLYYAGLLFFALLPAFPQLLSRSEKRMTDKPHAPEAGLDEERVMAESRATAESENAEAEHAEVEHAEVEHAAARRGAVWSAKLWSFLMIGACCVLIWTSMYVAFTEPGANEIAGVQGRYFLPLLYPLYGLLYRWRLAKLAGHMPLWYDLMIRFLPCCGLLATLWVAVISRFCL